MVTLPNLSCGALSSAAVFSYSERQPFHLCWFSTIFIIDQLCGPKCGGGNWETGRPHFFASVSNSKLGEMTDQIVSAVT